jgi:glycerophosphoryl diester phosphodiesterase
MRGTSHAPYIDGNTLDAIRAAHQGGIEYIEVDLVLTRDGELVTAHQPNVKDCGTLSKMLLIQIRGCKIGGALRVAELSEILEVPFKGVFLDLKDTLGDDLAHANRAVARAASIVSEKHRQQTAVLMLYQAPPDSLLAIRKHQLRAGLKGYPKAASETLEMVERASALGFEMLSVNAEHVTLELLADSTRRGVWHLPWSTDASAYDHWRALAKAGAGGLIVLHYELAKQQVAPHWTDARSLHLQ